MRAGPGLLGVLLLVLATGAGGAAVGLLVPGSPVGQPHGVAVLPAAGSDPGIPFPWDPGALSPVELQATGLDRAVLTLVLLGLGLLAVGAISAALYAFLEGSAGRGARAVHGLVGARPGRLIGRSLVWSVPAVLGGGALGSVLALWGVHRLLGTWPGDVAQGAPSPALLLLCIAGGAALVLLGATLPVLRVLRSGWLGDALSPHARTHPGLNERAVQGVTVTAQLLVTITLLYGAGLFFSTVEAPDPTGALPTAGSTGELVLVLVDGSHLSRWERGERYASLLQAVERVPGVRSAGMASRGALGGRGTLDWVLRPMAIEPIGTQAEHHAVTPGWFDTLGVAVNGQPPQGDGVVMNATLGRLIGWEGPEGEEGERVPVRLGGRTGTSARAVGLLAEDAPVVAPGWGRLYRAFPFGQITSRAPPVVYLPLDRYPSEQAEVLVRLVSPGGGPDVQGSGAGSGPGPDHLQLLAAHLGQAAGRLDLSVSSPSTVPERFAELSAPGRWFLRASGALTLFAMGLAVIGVAGAVDATARRRVAELGVRRAVGGSRSRVAAGLGLELLLPLAVAAFLGLGTAVAAGEALTSFLGSAPGLDLSLYAASLLLLVVATFLGALAPVLRATSVPPARAIRRGEGVDGAELA